MKKTITSLILILIVVCLYCEAIAEGWQFFDGEGATILEDVSVTKLSRFYMRLSSAGDLRVSFTNQTTGEDKLLIFEGNETTSAAAILFDPGNYDFFIETTSNWVAVVESIEQIDTFPDISATVSYVSDIFPIDKPIIVMINAKSEKPCLFTLNLFTKDGDDWKLTDNVTEFMIGDHEIQKIFRTEKTTVGIYVVDFPNGEWEIKKK